MKQPYHVKIFSNSKISNDSPPQKKPLGVSSIKIIIYIFVAEYAYLSATEINKIYALFLAGSRP